MFYPEIQSCISEKSKILIREKDKQLYTYKTLKQVAKLLSEKKEIYSIGEKLKVNKILSIEEAFVQEFWEIKTFSGATIYIGNMTEIFVDGSWIYTPELEYHERIYVYDILHDIFAATFVTSILPSTKYLKAYKVYAEHDTGIVVNNFIIRHIEKAPVLAFPFPEKRLSDEQAKGRKD
jgi:hypothetical protein